MDNRPPADDPLVAFLSGKRRWPRFDTDHRVLLRGVAGEFAGRVLDASVRGMLIVVEDPAFYSQDGNALDLVTEAFPHGVEVFFPETGNTVRGGIVRITGNDDGTVAMGCHLSLELPRAEAWILGIRGKRKDDATVEEGDLPRRPRRGSPLSLLVFGRGEPVAGPLYVARVEAAGSRVLDVRVPGPDGAETRIASDLGRDAFYAAVVRGRRRLWEGHARLVRLTVAMGEILLRVQVDGDLGRAVRRSLEAA